MKKINCLLLIIACAISYSGPMQAMDAPKKTSLFDIVKEADEYNSIVIAFEAQGFKTKLLEDLETNGVTIFNLIKDYNDGWLGFFLKDNLIRSGLIVQDPLLKNALFSIPRLHEEFKLSPWNKLWAYGLNDENNRLRFENFKGERRAKDRSAVNEVLEKCGYKKKINENGILEDLIQPLTTLPVPTKINSAPAAKVTQPVSKHSAPNAPNNAPVPLSIKANDWDVEEITKAFIKREIPTKLLDDIKGNGITIFNLIKDIDDNVAVENCRDILIEWGYAISPDLQALKQELIKVDSDFADSDLDDFWAYGFDDKRGAKKFHKYVEDLDEQEINKVNKVLAKHKKTINKDGKLTNLGVQPSATPPVSTKTSSAPAADAKKTMPPSKKVAQPASKSSAPKVVNNVVPLKSMGGDKNFVDQVINAFKEHKIEIKLLDDVKGNGVTIFNRIKNINNNSLQDLAEALVGFGYIKVIQDKALKNDLCALDETFKLDQWKFLWAYGLDHVRGKSVFALLKQRPHLKSKVNTVLVKYNKKLNENYTVEDLGVQPSVILPVPPKTSSAPAANTKQTTTLPIKNTPQLTQPQGNLSTTLPAPAKTTSIPAAGNKQTTTPPAKNIQPTPGSGKQTPFDFTKSEPHPKFQEFLTQEKMTLHQFLLIMKKAKFNDNTMICGAIHCNEEFKNIFNKPNVYNHIIENSNGKQDEILAAKTLKKLAGLLQPQATHPKADPSKETPPAKDKQPTKDITKPDDQSGKPQENKPTVPPAQQPTGTPERSIGKIALLIAVPTVIGGATLFGTVYKMITYARAITLKNNCDTLQALLKKIDSNTIDLNAAYQAIAEKLTLLTTKTHKQIQTYLHTNNNKALIGVLKREYKRLNGIYRGNALTRIAAGIKHGWQSLTGTLGFVS